MDTQTLKVNEISCPYCRNKESKLLPYYENMGVEKVHGVNYIDESKIIINHACVLLYFNGTCSFKTTIPDNTELCCHNTYVCTFEDGKDYCYIHIKNKLLAKKAEEKKLKMEAKLKEKEEKIKAKQKSKEEKESKKSNKKTNLNEISGDQNVIIYSENGCKQILKTGLRKGEICGCKITNEIFCKRHANVEKTK
jgi:hypothetical protein